MPHIAYAYPEHWGRQAARRLQASATVRALSQSGVTVHLLMGWSLGWPQLLQTLQLTPGDNLKPVLLPMWQAGPGLPLAGSWHGPFHWAALSWLRRQGRARVPVVLVRHLKLADYLLARRHKDDPLLVFEAHELFSRTAQEEGRSAEQVKYLQDMEARVWSNAHGLIAISEPLAQQLASYPGVRGPVRVVPSGVDDNFLMISPQPEPGLIAYAGGLGPWKGVDLLVRAVSRLPSCRMEILGGEYDSSDWNRLQSLISKLELGQRVIMRPQAGQDQVMELLARAQVAVWPGSARQRIAAEFTSPLKLFEYLAAGCPVVAPSLPAATSILTDGLNALLFSPDDEVALAQVLNKIISDPDLAERLAANGKELARKYTWAKRAEMIKAALAEVLA